MNEVTEWSHSGWLEAEFPVLRFGAYWYPFPIAQLADSIQKIIEAFSDALQVIAERIGKFLSDIAHALRVEIELELDDEDYKKDIIHCNRSRPPSCIGRPQTKVPVQRMHRVQRRQRHE